jgi:hypothetical protein
VTWFRTNKTYIADLVERVVWTFLEGFGAVWLLPVAADVLDGSASTVGTIWHSLANTSVLDKAAVGGIAAVLALGKGFIAKAVGDRNSAAILPADVEHVGGV